MSSINNNPNEIFIINLSDQELETRFNYLDISLEEFLLEYTEKQKKKEILGMKFIVFILKKYDQKKELESNFKFIEPVFFHYGKYLDFRFYELLEKLNSFIFKKNTSL